MSLPTIKSNFPKSFKMASKKRPQTSQKTENHYSKIKNKNKKFWISTVNILAMFNQLPIRDCFSDQKTATWIQAPLKKRKHSSKNQSITSIQLKPPHHQCIPNPIWIPEVPLHSSTRAPESVRHSFISPVWMKILRLLTLKNGFRLASQRPNMNATCNCK